MNETATAMESKFKVSDEVIIEIDEMHKWYGEFHVLKNINLTDD